MTDAIEPDFINFDEAVAQAKRHIESMQFHEMKLGELADRLEPKYGDQTLEKFAEEIGADVDDLNRWRSVYRAYKDDLKEIQGTSPKFGVLQAVQSVPEPARTAILKTKPTVRDARAAARNYHATHGEKDWRVDEARRWFAQAVKHAQQAIQYGHPAAAYMDPVILRQALDDLDQQMAALRLGGRCLIALAIKGEARAQTAHTDTNVG